MPKYNTVGKRILASLVDGLVFVPLGLLDIFLVESDNYALTVWSNLLQTLLWAAYVIIGHGKYGQTLGKKVLKIKVFDVDEINTIGYKRAFYREGIWIIADLIGIIYFIFQDEQSRFLAEMGIGFNLENYLSMTLLFWTILEIVTTLTNSKRRAIHDFIASSVVIDLEELKRERIENPLPLT